MRTEEIIEKLIRNIDVDTSAKVDEVVLNDILQVFEKSTHVKSAIPQPKNGRRIMNSTITKLAVAAVIVLVAGIGIALLNNSDNTGNVGIGESVVQEDAAILEAAKTKLEAEMKIAGQYFASGDIQGLVDILARDEYAYETKVAAANFLADIGDDSAITELERLIAEQIAEGGKNPFAAAIAAITVRIEGVVAEGTEALEPEALAVVVEGEGEKAGDELLQLVPTKSLFCVRVNNFDSAAGTMDQYLMGVSPMPIGLSMLARMQLAGLVGDPALNNINTQGNFAIFGVGLPAKADQSAPVGDIFIAALLPVSDYAKLVSENANFGEADANGISVIKVGGTVNPNKTKLAVRVGNYMVVSLVGNYDNLVSMAKPAAGAAGLGASLDANEVKAATSEPIWAYGNIQQVSQMFGPVLVGQLEKMKKQLEKMNESGQGGPPPTVMNMYFGMLDVVLNEVEFFSLCIKPQAGICNMTMNLATIPETPMAKMFGTAIPEATENKLLGYLEDGAIFNIGIRKNAAFWEEYSLSQFDFISFLADGNIPDKVIAKAEKMASEFVAAAGESGVISFSHNTESPMPFSARYVFEVKDAQRWNKTIDAAIDLGNTAGPCLAKVGIEGDYKIERGVDSYNEVSIDAAGFVMKATDPNTDYGKMIDQMYDGGIDYRFAVIDNLWLCVLGADCNTAIYDLIDEVKAGGQKEIAPEFTEGLAFIAEPDKSDFVGTVNIVRYMNMASAMAESFKDMPGATGPHIMPPIDAPSSSNIAFAGMVGNGKITVETALPKEHILEIKAAVEMMSQKMLEARQAAEAEKASKVEDANSSGEVNDANEATESSGETTSDPCSASLNLN